MTTELIVACTQAQEDMQQSAWASTFFPDDIPADWLFDYYSNEFSSLLCPVKKALEETFIEQLEESMCDNFQLVLTPQALLSQLSALAPGETNKNLANDWQSFSESCQDLSEVEIIYVSAWQAVNDFPGLYSASQINHISSAEELTKAIYYIEEPGKLEPKVLRALAEYFLAQTTPKKNMPGEDMLTGFDNDLTVFFSDSPFTIENSKNLAMISQML